MIKHNSKNERPYCLEIYDTESKESKLFYWLINIEAKLNELVVELLNDSKIGESYKNLCYEFDANLN